MKWLSIAGTVLVLLSAQPVFAIEGNKPFSIDVTGTGKVTFRPDVAQVEIGVQTMAKTAAQALAENNQAMAALLKTISENGVATKDVNTSGFSIMPEYGTPKMLSSSGNTQLVVGYRVSNEVSVRVRKIESLGPLLDAVVQSGANTVRGVSFSISEPDPLQDKARAEAVADARRKATVLAHAAGTELGRVLYITDSTVRPVMPMRAAPMMYAASQAVPIAVGESEMEVSVEVVYALP